MEDESEDLVDEGDEDEGERKPKKKAKAPREAQGQGRQGREARGPGADRLGGGQRRVQDGRTFDYNQKEAAQAQADELTAKGKGTHFLQKIKEPMPDNAPGLGAPIPRPVLEPEPVAAKIKPEPVDSDDDVEDEDEDAADDNGDDDDEE